MASFILLNGYRYYIDGKNYKAPANTFRSYFRGNTGIPVVVESAIYDNVYDLTLNCSLKDYDALLAAFAAQVSAYIDFVDIAGRFWNHTTGAGNQNTGVKILSSLDKQWITEAGEDPVLKKWDGHSIQPQRYLVKLKLQVNSTII